MASSTTRPPFSTTVFAADMPVASPSNDEVPLFNIHHIAKIVMVLWVQCYTSPASVILLHSVQLHSALPAENSLFGRTFSLSLQGRRQPQWPGWSGKWTPWPPNLRNKHVKKARNQWQTCVPSNSRPNLGIWLFFPKGLKTAQRLRGGSIPKSKNYTSVYLAVCLPNKSVQYLKPLHHFKNASFCLHKAIVLTFRWPAHKSNCQRNLIQLNKLSALV